MTVSSTSPEHPPLPPEVELLPADKRFDWLVNKYLDLTAKVAQARSDATHSAEYAVQAEDAAGALRGERLTLILSLKHLYNHLQAADPAAEITTPGDTCSERHPKIKEYIQ